MESILTNWGVIRVIRLVLGAIAIGFGITDSDPLLIIVGVALSGMAIFNAGCSPFASNCTVDPKKNKDEGVL